MKITWYGTASILLESEGGAASVRSLCGTGRSKQPEQSGGFCAGNGYLHHAWTCGSSFFIPEILEQADDHGFATRAVMNTLEGWVEDTGCLVEVEPGYSWRQGNIEDNGSEGKAYVILCETVFREAVKPGGCSDISAMHCFWPGRIPDSRKRAETAAYQIEAEGNAFYFLGAWSWIRTQFIRKMRIFSYFPIRGRENMAEAAMEIVERLKPARILLDHFDDAFPPVSEEVDTRPFKKAMDERHPEIKVVEAQSRKARNTVKPIAL